MMNMAAKPAILSPSNKWKTPAINSKCQYKSADKNIGWHNDFLPSSA
jgi:hypothetical protein